MSEESFCCSCLTIRQAAILSSIWSGVRYTLYCITLILYSNTLILYSITPILYSNTLILYSIALILYSITLILYSITPKLYSIQLINFNLHTLSNQIDLLKTWWIYPINIIFWFTWSEQIEPLLLLYLLYQINLLNQHYQYNLIDFFSCKLGFSILFWLAWSVVGWVLD